MYFVIHTTSGKEEELIERIKSKNYYQDNFDDCFVIKRIVQKKYEGKWHEVIERLFPGYIFIETQNPKIIHTMLNEVEGYSKVVGFRDKDIIHYIPLSEIEEDYIKGLAGKNEDHTISLSEVEVLEGKKIRVISGALLGQEGIVKKVDLHKRIAEVEITFLNQPIIIHFGLDIIKRV